MKLLHLLGHNQKWAMDAHFQNEIADGFIFGAYNFKYDAFSGTISGYKPEQYMDISLFDAQFYANKDAQGGKLDTYPFHPLHSKKSDKTEVDGIDLIFKAIEFQESEEFAAVIIPNFRSDSAIKTVKRIGRINKRLGSRKNSEKKYYLTIQINYDILQDSDNLEVLLDCMTDRSIVFNGYYLALEGKDEFRSKLCLDIKFMTNLLTIFQTLNKQRFEIIYPYANFDAILYYSLCDIDYISIGTYENLRKFSLDRFLGDKGGGPSKGWYFSEKLLNFIKAQNVLLFHNKKCVNLISNHDNIFSDAILNPRYIWNTHKPDVHKNYLLAISRIFTELSEYKPKARAQLLLEKIESARELYEKLWTDYRIKLLDESSDRHLGEWLTFLAANAPE